MRKLRLTVDEKAVKWFQEEMDVQKGEAVRIFVRYGGSTPVNTSYSLGVIKEQPKEIGVSTKVDEILFYIISDEIEYFDGHDLVITVDDRGELQFQFVKNG